MRTMSAKYELKFAKRKYELIHFIRISRKYNIIVDVTLARYYVEIKENIKILKIQLNSKLRFRSHLRQIETKLTIR